MVVLRPKSRASGARDERQHVHGRTRQEGCLLPLRPGRVAVRVVGRERVAALAARHVEVAELLAPGGDGEPLGRPRRGGLEPRHVAVAGQRLPRHVQEAAELRHGTRERVADERGVALAPRALSQPAPVLRQLLEDGVGRGEEERVPGRVLRVEEMRGTFCDERPDRPFPARVGRRAQAEAPRVLRARRGEERVEDEAPHPLAEAPDDAVAHRVDRGPPAPALHEPAGLRAAGVLRHGVRGEDAEEQLLPAREEEGVVVELHAQHVVLAHLVDGEETVPDLPLPRPEVVPSDPHLRELLSADDARVGREDAAGGRVHDTRVLVGREPAVPSPRPVRPGGRHAPVVAHAARDAADDRPSDAPRAVGGDEVLVRDAGLGGERLGLVEVADRLHADERGVETALAQRHPGERPPAAPVVGVDHRAPDSGLDGERLGLLAGHLDCLGLSFQQPGALGREIGVTGLRVAIQEDEVGPVALAVREAPGHVPVAARDHERCAGQRHPGDPPLAGHPGEDE